MTISPVLAKEAIDKLAAQLSLSPLAVATGIHDIANANMAAAIRRVTIERGIDPRGFTAVASGGAGPVHIARVASEFSIPRIIIPRHAGVASATGLLESDVVIDGVRSFVAPTLESAPGKLNACFEELERSGWNEIEGHGVPRNLVTVLRTIELRYRHQAHGLPVPVATAAITADTIVRLPAAFNEIHRTRFGIASDEPTEIMAVKVRMVGAVLKAVERQRKCRPSDGASALVAWRPAYFTEFAGYVDTPVYDRLRLESGDAFNGPALIQDTGATIVVPPGHTVAVDGYCNIIIEPTAGGTAFTASRPVEADRVLPSRNTVEAGANSPALGETGGG
jgi:N-methylhydantoinase A